MPKVTEKSANKLIAMEYGSGVYGTVMPTNTKGIVVKVTSDPNEAKFAFIVASKKIKPYPSGLVRYGKVLRLAGYRSDGSMSGFPIYVLWREEAYSVGRVVRPGGKTEEILLRAKDLSDPAFRLTHRTDLRKQHLLSVVRSVFWCQKGGVTPENEDEVAGCDLVAAERLASQLAKHSNIPEIGKTMSWLMRKHGIVLADVHEGNIGYARRRGRCVAVITDPGNVAFLSTRFDGVNVPELTPSNTQARTVANPWCRR